MQHLKN